MKVNARTEIFGAREVSKRKGRLPHCRNSALRNELLFEAEIAKAVADLARRFDDFHSGLHHQLAGERLAGCAIRGCFVGDAAILAFLIPAEPSHGDVVGREVLQGAQQHIVFRNLELSSQNLDGYKFIEGPIKRARVGHERGFIVNAALEDPRAKRRASQLPRRRSGRRTRSVRLTHTLNVTFFAKFAAHMLRRIGRNVDDDRSPSW